MPKIPRYENQAKMPGESGLVPVNPEKMAQPWETLHYGAAQIEDTSLYLSRIFQAIEERDKVAARTVKAQELGYQIKNDFDSLAESYSSRSDFEKFEPDAETAINSLKDKYQNQTKDDRDLNVATNRAFLDQAAGFMRVVRDKKRQVITDLGRGQFERDYQGIIQRGAEALSTGDKELMEITKGELVMTANRLVDSRILKPTEAEARILAFDKNVQEGFLTNAKSSEDPARIDAAIMAIDKGEFTAINAKEGALYKAALLTRKEHLQKELEVKADKQSIDNAYTYFKKDWIRADGKPDFDSIYKLLGDPDFLKAWDLNPQRKHSLEIILHAEESRQNNEVKKIQEKNAAEFLVKLNKGQATINDLNEMILPGSKVMSDAGFSEESALSEHDARYFKAAIENLNANPKTDPEAWFEVKDAIYAHKEPGEIRRLITKNYNRLSERARETLDAQGEATRSRDEDRELRRGNAYLVEMLSKIDGKEQTREGWENYFDASRALDDFVENARKKGTSLRAGEIWDKAKSIEGSFRKSIEEKVEAKRSEDIEKYEAKYGKYETIEQVSAAIRSGEIPDKDRKMVMRKVAERTRIKDLSQSFNTAQEVGEAFKRGKEGRWFGKTLNEEDAKAILKLKFGIE